MKEVPHKTHSPVPITVNHKVEKGQIWTTSPHPETMQGQPLEPIDMTVPVLIVDPGIKEKKPANHGKGR
ncbi:MAG: hypothetical protein HQK66_03460 [Desulfamplus sp.]|nr:hypothetical protein [Desulfamplus sp.]